MGDYHPDLTPGFVTRCKSTTQKATTATQESDITSTRTAAGLTAAAVAGLTVLTLAAPASAAQPACPWARHYAPGAGCVHNHLSLDRRSYCPGETATFTVVGFAPGSPAAVSFSPRPQALGSYTTDPNEAVHGSFTIPFRHIAMGVHTVTVTGTAENGKPTAETRTVRVVQQCSQTAGPDPAVASLAGGPLPAAQARTTRINAVNAAADTHSTASNTGEVAGIAAGGLLLTGAGPLLTRRLRRRTA